MTKYIIVVINVVIKNFFPIFGFFGAPGSTPPILSLKTSLFDRIPIGSTEKNEDDTFIFDMEDEIMNICRTFSIENKKQQQNLIETLKQNCRRIVREKTGKKPFTSINIARI